MRTSALPLTLAVALLGCGARSTHTPPPDDVLPERWHASDDDAGIDPTLDRWWTALDNPALDQTVDEVLAANLDLSAAWARIAQLDAVARQARAGLFPAVELDAQVSRARVAGSPPVGAQNVTRYELGLSAAYELDVWGRVRSARDAAELDRNAARADVEATLLVLAANTVDAWLELSYQRERRALLTAQLSTNETLLQLLEERMRYGASSALDLLQQQQQIDALSATLPLVDAAEATTAHRLHVLLGRAPRGPDGLGDASLPVVPPFPALGVPADLLSHRPDVRAARLRLEAADARVASAAAARLPTVRIGGGASLQSNDIADIADDVFWNLFAGLTAPLFQGGRLNAEVERNRAVVDERLAAYASTLLTAAREVEDAVALEAAQRDRIGRLEASLETATSTLQAALERYRRGATSYLTVISAIEGVQRVEQNLLDARRALWTHRVALYRALGGDWTRDITPDAPAPEAS